MGNDFMIVLPTVFISSWGFAALNKLLKSGYLLNQPNPTKTSMGFEIFQWTWRNTVVSFVHSLITSIWAVSSFTQEPLLLSDMIEAQSIPGRLLIALSTGYFIYDVYDMVSNDARRHLELLLHHGVVITAFSLALATNQYTGWAICSLLMEINSTFLHLRRLMKMASKDKTTMAIIVGIFQLMTFVSCRLMTSAWMVKWLTVNRPRIPFWHFLVAASGMTVLIPMNMVLLYRLAKSDLRKSNVEGKKVS